MRSSKTIEELEAMFARAQIVNAQKISLEGIQAGAILHETLRRRRDGDTPRQGDLSDGQLDEAIASYRAAHELMAYAQVFLDLAEDLRDRRSAGVTEGEN